MTGSLGTLGRPLVHELRDRGHEVWGCDLYHDPDPQHVRADVAIENQIFDAFGQAAPEAVYHLAAEFGRKNGEMFTEQLWRTATIGTRNVLELANAHHAHLLFASSSEVYGDQGDHDQWLAEDIFPPSSFPNEYALSKWTGEQQVKTFQRRHTDQQATILRFFNAYGPGEMPHPFRSVVALFCAKALAREPLPVYEGYWRTFMYIDDFIPTLANACEADLHFDTYNIGGADYREVEELATIILEMTPGSAGYDLIPEDQHNVQSKRPETWRAQDDLGHDPKITLEQGIPPTLAWMREAVGAVLRAAPTAG